MAAIILLIAFIIELAFAVCCIYTKSEQNRYESVFRIGVFAVFTVFVLSLDITWNFRWRLITLLLLIWAILGAVTLIRGRKDEKKYKWGRSVRKAIVRVLLIFIALIPAFVFPKYELVPTTGKHKVATTLYTYRDKNRIETYTDKGETRKLNVQFWYPEDIDGKYPLIVFSHGSFGVRTSNESLYNELASHGYVVASIDHTYQALFTTDVDGNTTRIDMGFVKEVSAEDAHNHKKQSYELYQKWMGIRKGDINFTIDYIKEEAEKNTSDRVYKLMDEDKIGIMGHSLGGSAVLGVGRNRQDVSAVIALESPFMDDIKGVDKNEFVFTDKIYPVPVLNVYSDSAWSHLSDWAQYRENYELLSNTMANAFSAHIKGVGHLSLTDLSLTSPLLTRFLNQKRSEKSAEDCLKTINKLTLEFFNCYLKGEGKFESEGTY